MNASAAKGRVDEDGKTCVVSRHASRQERQFASKRTKMKVPKEAMDLTKAAIQKNIKLPTGMELLLRLGEVA